MPGKIIRPEEITPEIVVGLWNHLSSNFNSAIVQKDESRLMGSLSNALDSMGIVDKESFLQSYCTTIFYTVYIPFEIGDTDSRWSLWDQLIIAVHEHHHVHQCQLLGTVQFATSYLSLKSGRAHWEAEAYRTELEMYWNLLQRIPSIPHVAVKILHYACGWNEVDYIRKFLDMSLPMIKRGMIMSPVSKEALNYLSKVL